MNNLNPILLNVLLNKYSKNRESILTFLSEEEVNTIKSVSIPTSTNQIEKVLPHITVSLANIHYSWVFPVLKLFSAKLHPFILSTLPENSSKGLMKMLGQTSQKMKLANHVKLFFNNYMLSKIKPTTTLTQELLPQSNLNILLKLNKSILVKLIGFLGVHDLAIELKQVIDKKTIKEIQAELTKEKLKYLQICKKKKDKITTAPLGIKNWLLKGKKLENLLQQRGIIRLSLALCNEHHDLIWLIAHKLDIGRGNKILSILSEQKPTTQNLFKTQVLELVKSLNTSCVVN